MAGLHPSIDHAVNGLNLTPPAATQPQNPNVAQSPQQPQPTQTPQDAQNAQTSQQDMQIMQQLKQLGVSDAGIQQAMDMLSRGANEHQVMQMLAQEGRQ
jgi:Holliday junction resolvasome RuvABC DNA-binding subunit